MNIPFWSKKTPKPSQKIPATPFPKPKRLDDGICFELPADALKKLQGEGLSGELVAQLEGLQEREFPSEQAFLEAVAARIGRPVTEKETPKLLKHLQVAYYYRIRAGKDRRTKLTHYTLFMDLGSYRTTVLCWPTDLVEHSEITNAWKYLVRKYEDERTGIGFPSAFIFTGDEDDFEFVPDVKANTRPDIFLIRSAKNKYVEDFAAYNGNVPSFNLYIQKVLEESLTYIIEPVSGRVWNKSEIPRIDRIKVTVPDLYIENLREGYKQSIFEVCSQLAQAPRWRALFPEELDKQRQTFVDISSDESGASELYFVNLLRDMPFWNLGRQLNKGHNMELVQSLFAQNTLVGAQPQELTFAVCHLDIGGLTTDASVVLLRSATTGSSLGVSTSLLRKESFSEPKAGEFFKDLYQEKPSGEDTDKWWKSPIFIEQELASFFAMIFRKQYELLKDWKKSRYIHGVYFLVSGRPSRADLVQTMLRTQILRIFNEDELLLLPDHCIFMATYRHVGSTGTDRYAEQIDDFEKLITILGNVYTNCHGYDVQMEKQRYYLSLDFGYEDLPCHEIEPGKEYNLKDFEDYQEAADKNVSVKVAFSKHPNQSSRMRFLTVRQSAGQVAVYPRIKIAEKTTKDRAWIIPSIQVLNLNEKKDAMSLAWSNPMLEPLQQTQKERSHAA